MPSPAKARSGALAFADAPAPPHSIEAEQAVLGGLLLDPVAWDNVADIVHPEDFYRPDHKLIFEAIGKLAGDGKPCDAVTISQYLDSINSLDAAGGLAYLSTIARETPTAANVWLLLGTALNRSAAICRASSPTSASTSSTRSP